jgi:hypothetical protein
MSDDDRDFEEEEWQRRAAREENESELEDEEERRPKRRTFTCNECGTSGSSQWMESHPCGDILNIKEFGGRCEEYPCCGHVGADSGCAPQESHTSGYWSRLREDMGDERYEDYLEALERQDF